MSLVVIGIYIFILVLVWGFALLARIHAFKFKDYSPHIVFVTKMLFLALLALSILGGYLVMTISYGTSTSTTQQSVKQSTSGEIY